MNPKVSDSYRLYYIDKSLKYSPREYVEKLLNYRLGEEVDFSSSEEPRVYLGKGWSNQGERGIWTKDFEADLILRIKPDIERDLELVVQLQAFVNELSSRQDVELLVNGEAVTQWTFVHGEGLSECRAIIPIELVKQDSLLQITFRIHNPSLPTTQGLSINTPMLGIGMHRLRIVELTSEEDV